MLKLSCTGFIIGEDPLKLGKCRGETTGVHIKNLTSLDSFGKQPDRQGLNHAGDAMPAALECGGEIRDDSIHRVIVVEDQRR